MGSIEEVSNSDISNITTVRLRDDGERPIRVREIVRHFIENDPDTRKRIITSGRVGIMELIKLMFPLSAVPIEIVRALITNQDNQNDNS